MPTLDKEQYTKAEVEDLITKSEEEVEEQLEVATREATMTDAQKNLYKGLSGDEKSKFLFASQEERDVEVAKATEEDAVIYTAQDGTEIRKSHGSMALKLARDNDRNSAKVAEMMEKAETDRLEKAAKELLTNLPGEVDTHVAILKAVEGIKDESVRDAAMAVLKAHNAASSEAFETVGTTSQPVLEKGASEAKLEDMAKAYQAKNPDVGFIDAYATVADANPELRNKAIVGE